MGTSIFSANRHACSVNRTASRKPGTCTRFYLSSVHGVVHHEKLELLDVVYEELLEAVLQHVAGLLVATVANVWHQGLSAELPADRRIDTAWAPP